MSRKRMNRPPDTEIVKLRCPECGRFLADVKGYGHGVCRDCGSEITYRSKAERIALPINTSKEPDC